MPDDVQGELFPPPEPGGGDVTDTAKDDDRERMVRLETQLADARADIQTLISEIRDNRHEQNGQQLTQDRRLDRLEIALHGVSPEQPGLVARVAKMSVQMDEVARAILTARVGWKAAALIGGAATTLASGAYALLSSFGVHFTTKS